MIVMNCLTGLFLNKAVTITVNITDSVCAGWKPGFSLYIAIASLNRVSYCDQEQVSVKGCSRYEITGYSLAHA